MSGGAGAAGRGAGGTVFAVDLPDDWRVLDIDAATSVDSMRRLLDDAARHDPQVAADRAAIERAFRQAVAEAQDAGVAVNGDLPPPLRQALQEAGSAVDAEPSGHLPLHHRRPIWQALGDPGPQPGSPGHRRRATLDLLAIERVKPVWDAAYPDDPAVDNVLQAARQALTDGLPLDEARRLANRADVDFLARPSDDVGFGPAMWERGPPPPS